MSKNLADIINKVHCADCLEFMKKSLPNESVAAIITDPPFAYAGGISNGMTANASSQFFQFWWRAICEEFNRIAKPETEGFIWCDWRTAPIIAAGFEPQFQTYRHLRVSQMLYHYREMPGNGNPFRSSVDMIAYLRAWKSSGERIGTSTHNFISQYWYYGKHEYHPAEKSVEIVKRLIQWCTNEGDTILDPFLGSGTTAVAAKQLGRNFIGVEINPEYCKIAEERLKQEVLPFSQPKPEPQKNPDLFEANK